MSGSSSHALLQVREESVKVHQTAWKCLICNVLL